jgi:outer membrane receptor for ferrienterochelin and colicins
MLCAIIACISMIANPAYAQGQAPNLTDMSLEDLMNVEVYSASKHSQSAKDAPSSVTVVTAEEIRRYGYRTLANVLQNVRGFYVNYDRNYSYVGVRGFAPPGDYNSRILLLVDGHRLNDDVFDQAPIGTELPLDIDAIERIEIVRGPSSSLYGADAFLAVINLITKLRSSVKHGEISAEADSFRGYKGHFTIGETLPTNIEMLLAGSIYESRGRSRLFFPAFQSPATNNGFAADCDDDAAKDLLVKMKIRDFTVQSLVGSREKGIPTASFGTVFNDPRTRTIDSYGNVVLTFNHRLGETTSVLTSLSYNRYEYSGYYVYVRPAGSLSTVLNRDLARGDWWGWEGQFQKRIGSRNDVTAGAELHADVRKNQRNYDIGQLTPRLDVHNSSALGAIFVQDELKIWRKLTLSAGVRYDRFESFGGTINPRIAVLFHPNEPTTLKLLYGQAFRPPNAYELFYAFPGSQEANPALNPETIRTYEAVLDRNVGSHLQLSASGYYYRISGLIQQTVDAQNGLLVFENAARSHAMGVEFEVRGKWAGGLETRASYSLQNSRDAVTGLTLANSPAHLVKVNAMLPVFKGTLLLGPEGQYMSNRKTLTAKDAGGFGIVNLTLLTRRLARGAEASATAYNLLDKRYSNPVGPEILQTLLPQDGRSLRFKVAYSF